MSSTAISRPTARSTSAKPKSFSPSPIAFAMACARVTPMTFELVQARQRIFSVLLRGSTLPVLTLIMAILLVWYVAAIWLNAPFIRSTNPDLSFSDLVIASWRAERPVLPAPHQVLVELRKTVLETAVTSKRSLLYHAWV